MTSITERICTGCGESKLESDFYTSKYNRRSQCKSCDKARASKWYLIGDNAKKTISRVLAWKKDNPEKNTKLNLLYQKRHPEKINKKNREWSKLHPDYKRAQKFNRRALEKSAEGKITAKQWRELIEKYEYTCLRCGRKEPEIKLALDHIVPLKLGGRNVIENAQPLCKSCNSSKGIKVIDYR